MIILDILAVIAWVAGGGYTAKRAVAQAERHYLELAAAAGRPQNHMDTDDWCGAVVYASLAFVCFPAIATGWLLSYPARWLYRPARAYMLPPAQQTFEVRVRNLNAQKALVMSTVGTYRDVLGWEPKDDHDRVGLLQSLQETITEQMQQLMRIADTTNPTGFDGDYLAAAKDEVKAITAGGLI